MKTLESQPPIPTITPFFRYILTSFQLHCHSHPPTPLFPQYRHHPLDCPLELQPLRIQPVPQPAYPPLN
ncbi:hypothetical protein NA56DRAFT_76030 [Hyaloscypha hepaticicola]|uniref:Uncharacterized protein n=1 Tax=Hyaloscypha hepaticicola TaxID=2082293 RepID=A0A2J6Q973_9HELO|nr:hypothetical protein NA56DRAFT_76030 [Hyaloscypha hepaticicola]